jgi:hypothetical protein
MWVFGLRQAGVRSTRPARGGARGRRPRRTASTASRRSCRGLYIISISPVYYISDYPYKINRGAVAKVVPRPPPAPEPALGDCITTIPLSMQRHVDAAFGIGDNRSRGALDCPGLPGAKWFKQP